MISHSKLFHTDTTLSVRNASKYLIDGVVSGVYICEHDLHCLLSIQKNH